MPQYTTVCIMAARASADKVLSVFRRVTSEVTNRGGVVRQLDNLGCRQLAYRMRAHQQWNYIGRYFLLRIEASPMALREVHHVFKTQDCVVRWLTQSKKTASRKPLIVRSASNSSGLDPGVYSYRQQKKFLDWKSTRLLIRSGVIKPELLRKHVKRIVTPGEASVSQAAAQIEAQAAAATAVAALPAGTPEEPRK